MTPTKTKFFQVRTANGELVPTEQLATFAFYICNIQIRFVVTRSIDRVGAEVTERETGYSVCHLSPSMSLSHITTWKDRGQAALRRLIETHGEQRVYDVIAQGQRNVARNGS